MSVDINQVRHIAKLARIAMSEEELERLVPELNNILGWIEQLGEVDTNGVEPMRSVMPIAAHWREDVVTDGNRPEEILQNAPKSHDGYFVVPKVVE